MPNVVPIQTLVYEMGGYVQLNTSSVVFQRVQRGRIISCTSLLFSPPPLLSLPFLSSSRRSFLPVLSFLPLHIDHITRWGRCGCC